MKARSLLLLVLLLPLSGCNDQTESFFGFSSPKLQSQQSVETSSQESSGESLSRNQYPFEATLTDRQGRTIEVEILGKSGEQIFFARKPANRQFSLPLSKLSDCNQTALSALPDGGAREIATSNQPPSLAGRRAIWHSQLQNAEREASELGIPLLIALVSAENSQNATLEKQVIYSKQFKDWADQNVSLVLVETDEGSRDTRFLTWKTLARYGIEQSSDLSMVLVDPKKSTAARINLDTTRSASDAIGVVQNQISSRSDWSAIVAAAEPVRDESPFRVNGGPVMIDVGTS